MHADAIISRDAGFPHTDPMPVFDCDEFFEWLAREHRVSYEEVVGQQVRPPLSRPVKEISEVLGISIPTVYERHRFFASKDLVDKVQAGHTVKLRMNLAELSAIAADKP